MALQEDPEPPESLHAGPGFPRSARLAEIPGAGGVCCLYEIAWGRGELWAVLIDTPG